jgi:hypothetical protein
VKKSTLTIILVLASALLVLAGCSKNDGGSQQTETAAAASAPAAQPAAQPAADPNVWSGTVVETMNAGGYTYVLLDKGSEQIWVAGPETSIAVGDAVSMSPGMAMPNFESKTLERTFDVVYFVGGIEKADGHSHEAEAPGGQAAGGMPAGMGMGGDAGSHMTTGREQIEGVAKADGGYTVAEIFVNAADLKDQTIKVRGRVVKFTPNIMGTNWIHIQDGTGAEGTHDLTITTNASAKTGDVVLVEGPLSIDRDFGAGYRYPVIIEGATVVKE